MPHQAQQIPYSHPMVRDLAWVLFSAPICNLTNIYDKEVWKSPKIKPWLQFLDQHPISLVNFLENHGNTRDRRLGAYFERLVWFFLTQSPDIDDVINGLQVIDNKKTLGEFDFLYRPSNENTYTHLEVCVKFYLCKEGFTHSENWLGPNSVDRLKIKMDRTLEHQLELSKYPAAQKMLACKGVDVGRKKSIFLGRLFYPWDLFSSQNFDYPKQVSVTHTKGWWLSTDDFLSIKNNNFRLKILRKTNWLAPLYKEELSIDSAQQILEQASKSPIMVARISSNIENELQELDRGMIIPRDWPRLD